MNKLTLKEAFIVTLAAITVIALLSALLHLVPALASDVPHHGIWDLRRVIG